MSKQKTSHTLSIEAKRILRHVSRHLGISQSAVIELALREYERKVAAQASDAHAGRAANEEK